MAKEQYIVGLDVGTQNIRVVQGKLDQASPELAVIGAVTVPSAGMRKGVIVDIEETVSSISSALEKLERMTGVPITRANVSVGGNHILCIDSHGVIAVSRADGEISESDIVRVVDASQAISIPPNREVVHVIPKTFILDGQSGIKDPLGMSGIRLEVDTTIIHAGLPFIKNASRAILQAGLEIDQMVVSPLACAQAVLTKRQKELGVCALDLGAGTTNLAVYEEGTLLHAAVLPLGSMHITNDIAIGLRCSIDTAERVKLLYGSALPASVDRHQDINLASLDPEEQEKVSRLEVAEIIEARVEEIFDYVNKQLKKIGRDGKLPAGIVLCGAGSHLPGILEFTKKYLKLPVALGQPEGIASVIDQVNDPAYATAVGLVLWGERFGGGLGAGGLSSSLRGLLENQNVLKLRKWFKSFLP